MLIAQTGTGSASPSNAAELQGSSSVAILWWLVPLAVAVIWIAWYFRAKRPQPTLTKNSKPSSRQSAKRPRNTSASNDVTDASSVTAESIDSTKPRNTGSKKKKKDKNKGNRKSKPVIPSAESPLKAGPPLMATSEKSPDGQATSKHDAGGVPPPSKTEPKPSNAIFEPLRTVSKERRRSSAENNSEINSSRNDSRPRENDAFDQIFGGKFERIIPKATIRSTASRWPTPTTQRVKSSEPVAEKPQPIAPASHPITLNPVLPEAQIPAIGLKSFVTKVKSSSSSDSQAELSDD